MALSKININILDHNLGFSGNSLSRTQLKLGICDVGVPNQLYSISSLAQLKDQIGLGPLTSAVAEVIAEGGSCLIMPLKPSVAGGASTVVHNGAGTGTMAVSFAPRLANTLTITKAGAIGTSQYSIDGSAPTITASTVNYGLLAISMAAGSYVLGDTYTFGIDGYVSKSNPSSPAITMAANPVDNFDVVIKVVVSGALGTARITYSLDNSNNESAPLIIPTSGKVVLPNSGIVLTFTGAQTQGDTFTFKTAAPFYASSDITAAADKLTTDYIGSAYFLAHFVGHAPTAAATATMVSSVSGAVSRLRALHKPVRAVVETPTSGSVVCSSGVVSTSTETDQAVVAAFADINDATVNVAAGDVLIASAMDGLYQRRNCAQQITARVGILGAAIKPSQVSSNNNAGAISRVVSLFHDELANPAFNDGRLWSMRTWTGVPGYFCAGTPSLAETTSDYSEFILCEIVDRLIAIGYPAAIKYMDMPLAVKADGTGQITEKQARIIEIELARTLNSQMVNIAVPDCVSIIASVDRTSNLIGSHKLNITLSAVPFGYASDITLSVGFSLGAAQ